MTPFDNESDPTEIEPMSADEIDEHVAETVAALKQAAAASGKREVSAMPSTAPMTRQGIALHSIVQQITNLQRTYPDAAHILDGVLDTAREGLSGVAQNRTRIVI